jgi:ATP-dependent DNA ligase
VLNRDLMRRRRPQQFYAFDLLWLDGRDLRGAPLVERKRLLHGIIPPQPSPVLYVDHVVELFNAVCARDLEGVARSWRPRRARRRLPVAQIPSRVVTGSLFK